MTGVRTAALSLLACLAHAHCQDARLFTAHDRWAGELPADMAVTQGARRLDEASIFRFPLPPMLAGCLWSWRMED